MSGLGQNFILLAIMVVATAGIAGAAMNDHKSAQILGFCSLICVTLLAGLSQAGRAESRTENKQTADKVAVVGEKAEIAASKVEAVAEKAEIAASKVEAVAEKAEMVRTDLIESDKRRDGSMQELKEVAASTHSLVNDRFDAQLKLYAVIARRLANISRDPADVKAAEASEKVVADSLAKEAEAKAPPEKPSEPKA